MVLTSLQACMDNSTWLQGVNHMENRTDSSSPSGEDLIITSSKHPQDKLRPPSEKQVIKCPRCDSIHTKFCYYNNYSLSQPRYYCKTCRRYWTKGGSLRNIPVGGGVRKNKRVTAKKSSERQLNVFASSSSTDDPTNLQLSFPDAHLSHFTNLLGGLENSTFMESRFDALLGNNTNHDFMGSNELNLVGDLGDVGSSHGFTHNFYGFCPPFGLEDSLICESNRDLVTTTDTRILPFGESEKPDEVETKKNKFFSLDWQDYGYTEPTRKDSVGTHLDSIGSWNTVMNCYGSSATKIA